MDLQRAGWTISSSFLQDVETLMLDEIIKKLFRPNSLTTMFVCSFHQQLSVGRPTSWGWTRTSWPRSWPIGPWSSGARRSPHRWLWNRWGNFQTPHLFNHLLHNRDWSLWSLDCVCVLLCRPWTPETPWPWHFILSVSTGSSASSTSASGEKKTSSPSASWTSSDLRTLR